MRERGDHLDNVATFHGKVAGFEDDRRLSDDRVESLDEGSSVQETVLLDEVGPSYEKGDATQIGNESRPLSSASAHTNDNLPIILAGGGFKHAGHVAFDRKHNMQLSNLFVRMLQQMGLAMDKFGNSDGAIGEV